MNRHICLLYLKDKLSDKKYLEFFYRMGSALKIEEQHLIQLSLIIAPYGLFPKGPLSAEELKPLKKIASVTDCNALCKKAMYKAYSIQEHACCLCVFSTSYQNARENEERSVIRYLLRKDVAFQHLPFPETIFHSLLRLSNDYAIGTKPIVPFYFFLYSFLSKEKNKTFSLEELTQKYSLYLYQKLPELTSFQADAVQEIKAQIHAVLSSIYAIPEYSINEDVFQDSLTKLSYYYEYEPISFIKTIINKPAKIRSSNPNINTIAGIEQAKKELLEKQNSSQPLNKKNAVNITAQTPINEKEESKIEQNPIIETTQLTEKIPKEDDTFPSSGQGTNLSMVIEKKESNPLEELETNLEQALAKQVLAFESQPLENIEKPFDKKIPITTTFFARIHRVTRKNIYVFTHSMQRSYNICIEPYCYEKRSGLLFYTSYNKTFFFFEPDLFDKQLLQFLLTDEEINYFTMHYIDVMSLFEFHQINCFFLQEIPALYNLVESLSVSDPITILNHILSDSIKTDTYWECMPYYHKAFESLYLAAEKKDVLKSYHQILLLYRILARSYNLSILNQDLSNAFFEEYFLKYKFQYDFQHPIHTSGILYQIKVPNLNMDEAFQPNNFLMTMILLLEQQHYRFRFKVKLLTIKEHYICFFFLGTKQESSHWYDSYLSALQEAYEKQFHKPLKSKTICIEFTKK